MGELARLPGIGRKTALRMALHLLKRDVVEAENLGNAIIRLRNEVTYCARCRNISDEELCAMCANPRRDPALICVCEDIRDVMAIENTGQYNGLYHVLGGIISPMEGIGPQDLNISELISRASSGEACEVILALPGTIEGDTTGYYLYKRLVSCNIRITVLARGIPVGDELEHTDEVTLGRAMVNRVEFSGK